MGGGSEGERPVGGRVLGSVHDGLLIKPVFLNTLEIDIRRGPALGGLDLVFCDDLSQITSFPRLPTARSVQRAKARRSSMEFAIAHRTTKSFFRSDVVIDLQLKKSCSFS